MTKEQTTRALLGAVLLLAATTGLRRADAAQSGGPPVSNVAPDQVVNFVERRFGLAPGATMKANPLRRSISPDFDRVSVVVEDGKPQDKKILPFYISKNGHDLVAGSIYLLSTPGGKDEILRDFRGRASAPPGAAFSVGTPRPSSDFPDLYAVKISPASVEQPDVYLTRDQSTLLIGRVFRFSAHPERDVVRAISTSNQPSSGPATAPVTVVEYADLDCPMCAQMHRFLEEDLLPRYPGKLRIVFKEFPVKTKPWDEEGAIANECAYEIAPQTFVPYRTLIFQHLSDLDAAQADPPKVRSLLLDYGKQAGVDRARLEACVNSMASLPRVKRSYDEAVKLSVFYMPTFFVNGRFEFGLAPPQDFYRAVDEALRDAGSTRSEARKQPGAAAR